MVGGDPPAERTGEPSETEGVQVDVLQAGAAVIDDAFDLAAFGRGRESQPRVDDLIDGLVATGAAEDEVDGGQEPLGLQTLNGRVPTWNQPQVGCATVTVGDRVPGSPGSLAAAVVADEPGLLFGKFDQLRIHGGWAGEQVVDPASSDHVLEEWDRTLLGHHHGHRASNLGKPVTELLGVADGGRQRDHLDRVCQPDDHLLPHRSAEPVGQVVHLVHDDEAEIGKGGGSRVDHVAEHLGGHDHHRGVPVDGGVAGEQADIVVAVQRSKIVVLLVTQGLDRSGVETLATGRKGTEHRKFPHHRLTGTGGCCNQDARAVLDVPARIQLVGVKLERVTGGELRKEWPDLPRCCLIHQHSTYTRVEGNSTRHSADIRHRVCTGGRSPSVASLHP